MLGTCKVNADLASSTRSVLVLERTKPHFEMFAYVSAQIRSYGLAQLDLFERVFHFNVQRTMCLVGSIGLSQG